MASRVLLNKINPSLPAPAQPVELEPHLALPAAVFQLAIRDAQRGSGPQQVAAAEVERVFTYPKIQNRLQSRKEEIGAFLDLLRSESLWVEIQEQLNVVAPDESDSRYIETAVAGKANYIVTEDNHLLALGRYRGIEILTPAAFILNYSRVKV